MSKSLPALTGIRGVAATWVVLYHIAVGVPGFTMSPILKRSALVADGFHGVDLFFILSGFIMFYVHAADFRVIRRQSLLNFLAMRCMRIYPAHLVTMLFILCVVVELPNYVSWFRAWAATMHDNAYTWPSFIQTATLTTRWFVPDLGFWNFATWSLSVELLAYCMLPFLARWLQRSNSRSLCLLLAFASVACMLALLWVVGSHDGNNPNRPGIARGFCGFVAGAAMCRFVALTPASRRQAGFVASFAVILMITLIETGFGLFVPFSFLLLIPALAYGTGWVNALLSSRPVMFLGKISYSIYLVHVTPVLLMEWYYATGHLDTNWTDIPLYLLCVLALATALHFGVELPAQRLTRVRIRSAAAAAA